MTSMTSYSIHPDYLPWIKEMAQDFNKGNTKEYTSQCSEQNPELVLDFKKYKNKSMQDIDDAIFGQRIDFRSLSIPVDKSIDNYFIQ